MEYGLKKIINRYSILNNEKNIKNGMLKWINENDAIEDDRRMVRNRVIK